MTNETESIKNIVSYGGGTQSTALIIMALEGDYNLTRPDFAVYSDTGAEPEFVNEYIRYFIAYVKEKYDFDIFTTMHKQGLVEHLKSGKKQDRNGEFYTSSVPPLFTLNEKGEKGMLMRQCTYDFKTNPCNKLINSKLQRGEHYNLWKGISFDERSRAKISTDKKKTFIYPLVDNYINRVDSINYLKSKGVRPAQRSSCFFCPFHSDRYWIWLRKYHLSEFQRAVEMETVINNLGDKGRVKTGTGFSYYQYFLHSSCVPLDKVQFNNENQLDMFTELIDECNAECGI